MKLRYYLRGLGIGIILTTVILMIAYSGRKTELTDEEIIKRAEALGMVMEEDADPLFPLNKKEQDTESEAEAEIEAQKDSEDKTKTDDKKDTQESADEQTANESEKDIQESSESESEALATGKTYRLVVPPGTAAETLCYDLETNGVIDDASEFLQYLKDMEYITLIMAGQYDVPYGATNEQIYDVLRNGKIPLPQSNVPSQDGVSQQGDASVE